MYRVKLQIGWTFYNIIFKLSVKTVSHGKNMLKHFVQKHNFNCAMVLSEKININVNRLNQRSQTQIAPWAT